MTPKNDRFARTVAEEVATLIHEVRMNLEVAKSAFELLPQKINSSDVSEPDLWGLLQRNLAAASFELSDFLVWSALAPFFGDRQVAPVDITSVLRTIVAKLRTTAAVRQIKLVTRIPDEPVFVLGFEAALHRALIAPVALAIYGTHPTTQTNVALEVEGDRAILTVSSDDVYGIPYNLGDYYSDVPDLPELRSGMWATERIVAQLGGEVLKPTPGANKTYVLILQTASVS